MNSRWRIERCKTAHLTVDKQPWPPGRCPWWEVYFSDKAQNRRAYLSHTACVNYLIEKGVL